MSKYIIDLNDKDKEVCEKYVNCELGDELSDYVNITELAGAIASGTPYNPSGDCISRSDLKKEVVGMMINKADDLEEVEFEINSALASVCEKIDKAQPVPQVTVFTENADEQAVADLKAELQNVIEARPQGECRTCRHRDPEDKKCDCGALERHGCPFPVSDDYFCKFYEKGGAE